VARIRYTSQSTYPLKKVAKKEASKLALEIIFGKTRDERPLMYKKIFARVYDKVKLCNSCVSNC